MTEPDYRSGRPLTYSGPNTEEAIAMHRAARTVKVTGGSVKIGGVKITPCDDAFGRTDEERVAEPQTGHAITSVKLTPTGSGAQQLLVTDDTGRVLDFSNAVFNDRLAVREVGEEDGFRQYGLDVTLVLSPGSDTSIAAPAGYPPAMRVPPAEATEQWVRLDGVGHLETISLVPDPASTVTIGYAKYRDLLRQTGWQEVQDR